jgi:hypothetical protein
MSQRPATAGRLDCGCSARCRPARTPGTEVTGSVGLRPSLLPRKALERMLPPVWAAPPRQTESQSARRSQPHGDAEVQPQGVCELRERAIDRHGCMLEVPKERGDHHSARVLSRPSWRRPDDRDGDEAMTVDPAPELSSKASASEQPNRRTYATRRICTARLAPCSRRAARSRRRALTGPAWPVLSDRSSRKWSWRRRNRDRFHPGRRPRHRCRADAPVLAAKADPG